MEGFKRSIFLEFRIMFKTATRYLSPKYVVVLKKDKKENPDRLIRSIFLALQKYEKAHCIPRINHSGLG